MEGKNYSFWKPTSKLLSYWSPLITIAIIAPVEVDNSTDAQKHDGDHHVANQVTELWM